MIRGFAGLSPKRWHSSCHLTGTNPAWRRLKGGRITFYVYIGGETPGRELSCLTKL